MFRTLLSLAAIAAVLAATLILPTETQARRCPVEIPETLLSLYQGSDAIAIATFDRIEDGETEKTEHYTLVKTKSYYTVSTTLKGEPQKMMVLEDNDYRYEQAEASEPELTVPDMAAGSENEVVLELDETEDPREVKPGDIVLLFLKTTTENEEGEDTGKTRLIPVGYQDGIKKLPTDVLRTYEDRINQLNVIFNSAGNRDAAVLEWLISVTEDPITRWEGAFELLQAAQELEWAEAEAKRRAEAEKESEDGEAGAPAEAEETEYDETEDPESQMSVARLRYAKLITDSHKQALMNILLSGASEQPEEGKERLVSRGDQVLLQLVRNWGDARLAGFLLDQLRAGAGDAYHKYQLMDTIASSLKDETLVSLAEEYSDRLYESDDAVIEADSLPVETGTADTGAGQPAEGEAKEDAGAGKETPAPKTFGQKRAEVLAKFVAAADQRIATGA